MPSLFKYRLSLLLAVLLLAGCQTLEIKSKQESLDKVLQAYETAIRWSYIRQVYRLMKPEKIKGIKIPRGLENIKVTQYEILEPAVSDKSNIARQVAIIKYVEKDRQKEKVLTNHQLWEYDEKTERWYLISEIPPFVTEPKMHILPLGR